MDSVVTRRIKHVGNGEIYTCVVDEKKWLQEVLFQFNETTVNANKPDFKAGVTVAFMTVLEHLDRMEEHPNTAKGEMSE